MVKFAKKLFALCFACVMVLCTVPFMASAQVPEGGTLKVMAYNVSGLPIIGSLQGSSGFVRGGEKAQRIGRLLNTMDIDIIGVQEDFNYHDSLAGAMTAFPYQSFTSGGVPLGDGLNVFSKLPVYNIARTTWKQRFGILSGASDELTKKGFMSTVVEIAEGVYIDVYVLHADAGRDPLSIVARTDNYRQLAADINARTVDRAVIVMGDFNTAISRDLEDDIYGNLMEPAGLLDAWVELHNGGDYFYDGGENWNPVIEESIDKVLYKNGGGVTFTPETLEHVNVTDAEGNAYADHHATIASLSYTVTDAVPNTQELVEPQALGKQEFFSRYLSRLGEALKLIFSDLKNLPSLLSGLF